MGRDLFRILAWSDRSSSLDRNLCSQDKAHSDTPLSGMFPSLTCHCVFQGKKRCNYYLIITGSQICFSCSRLKSGRAWHFLNATFMFFHAQAPTNYAATNSFHDNQWNWLHQKWQTNSQFNFTWHDLSGTALGLQKVSKAVDCFMGKAIILETGYDCMCIAIVHIISIPFLKIFWGLLCLYLYRTLREWQKISGRSGDDLGSDLNQGSRIYGTAP